MAVSNIQLDEILSNFPRKYETKEEEVRNSGTVNKNIEVANAEQIAELKSRLRENVVHNSDCSKILDSIPELVALNPDLVEDQERKKRKIRRRLN